MKAETDSV